MYYNIETIHKSHETNFGTAYETYKEAVKPDSNIRLQHVKYYLNKRDDIQVNSKPRGSDSCVSPGAKFEYEIYFMDVLARDGVGTPYAIVAIDNFSKVAEVIPITSRQPA